MSSCCVFGRRVDSLRPAHSNLTPRPRKAKTRILSCHFPKSLPLRDLARVKCFGELRAGPRPVVKAHDATVVRALHPLEFSLAHHRVEPLPRCVYFDSQYRHKFTGGFPAIAGGSPARTKFGGEQRSPSVVRRIGSRMRPRSGRRFFLRG